MIGRKDTNLGIYVPKESAQITLLLWLIAISVNLEKKME